MSSAFTRDIFYGHLIKGNLKDAMKYLEQFPEQEELYQKYVSVFEKEEYLTLTDDDTVNAILIIYQRYYREVFYLETDERQAAENMRKRFADFFGIGRENAPLCELEENEIAAVFRSRSFHFLGGKTSGYYGPYIWKTEELKSYDVELPDGVKEYSVMLLDDFISKSWYDYISFGEISTGGWTDGDGIINCIESFYDFEDENFTVSLLKHEAQHAADLAKYKNMSSEDLEYRAKLVELIYSNKRNLLEQFMQEADTSDSNNGHALASHRIVEGFTKRKAELNELSIKEIQSIARELFRKSNEEIKIYSQEGK